MDKDTVKRVLSCVSEMPNSFLLNSLLWVTDVLGEFLRSLILPSLDRTDALVVGTLLAIIVSFSYCN
jgi:hypothetical protein